MRFNTLLSVLILITGIVAIAGCNKPQYKQVSVSEESVTLWDEQNEKLLVIFKGTDRYFEYDLKSKQFSGEMQFKTQGDTSKKATSKNILEQYDFNYTN